MADADVRFEEFRNALATRGLEDALAVLNREVPHRYSAVYRLRGSVLLNHLLFDKRGEVTPDYLAAVPFESSFCQFVFREGVFNTADSGADQRLDGHPYQGIVISYTGVPILDVTGNGEIIGSLCHFDLVRHGMDDGEFELLQRASRLIDAKMLER